MKRIFTGPDDVEDVFGRLHFGANGLRRLGAASLPPGMKIHQVLRRPDGSWTVLGFQIERRAKDTALRLLRGRTCDGLHFENVAPVFETPPGDWLGCSDMAYNDRDDRILFFTWYRHEPALFGLHVFASDDGGDTWAPLAEEPVYYDHDSFGTMWDRRTGEYVIYQATYQRWDRKPYKDNAGIEYRRVMHLRTSPDGLSWLPSDKVSRLGHLMDPAALITPDEDDPPELEFYRFYAFPYHDRYVGMQLNYAPLPEPVGRGAHGPHLGGEWWVSRDGRNWRRPYREVYASGEAPGIIAHDPMTLGGRHRWVIGGCTYGVSEDRLFYVGSLATAAFSTPVFEVPDRPLAVNAAFNFHDDPARGMAGQGYLMAEVQTPDGRTLEGYEAERCILRHLAEPAATLRWGDATTVPLAGRPARLRITLRDARLYAVCTR